MKEIKGYLIDRTTGVGISGKAVTFKDLAGTDISTGTHGTVYQVKDSVTQADGSFSFKCELSPGPINVDVTVSGTEEKKRFSDEKAQMGIQFSSDISRVGRGLGNGFVRGYLNELALSIVSGHTFRIATGEAIIDGVPWSLEDIGGAGGYDILGTTNPAVAAANPRLDLVSLRQYKESAAGQLAGKQDVVVTLGTVSNVVPATPTGADFTALPIGVLSTAEGAATKTIYADKRTFLNPSSADMSPKYGYTDHSPGFISLTNAYQTWFTAAISGLDLNRVYDGWIDVYVNANSGANNGTFPLYFNSGLAGSFYYNQGDVHINEVVASAYPGKLVRFRWPITGVTGVSSWSADIQFKATASSIYTISSGNVVAELRPRI